MGKTNRLAFLAVAFFSVAAAQSPSAPVAPQSGFGFTATARLVPVDLAVYDSTGEFVRNLTPHDLTILEDGRPQTIAAMELENVDAGVSVSVAAPNGVTSTNHDAGAAPEAYRDRRLLVLFFDFTSLGPLQAQAAVEWSERFVASAMRPADMVQVVAFGDRLEVAQPFTSDRDTLAAALRGLLTQTGGAPPRASGGDRSLLALRAACRDLAAVQQKKSLLLFTAGLTGSPYRLRETETVALGSNVALYPWDAAGLQAPAEAVGVPGGRGIAVLTLAEAGRRGPLPADAPPADAPPGDDFGFLESLAADTGGAMLAAGNDPGPVFARLAADTSSYYLLTYYTSDAALDGRLRSISIRVDRPGLELNYRERYFAPRDFAHLDPDERARQLRDEAVADAPEQALKLAAVVGAEPGTGGRERVTVHLNLPADELPLRAPLDVLVLVADDAGNLVAQSTGEVKPGAPAAWIAVFQLPAGRYRIRAAVRDDGAGRMGAAAAAVIVP